MTLRYVGDGQYIVGVPARDLTEVEAGQFGGIDSLVASELYVKDDEPCEPIQPIETAALSEAISLYGDADDESEPAGNDPQEE